MTPKLRFPEFSGEWECRKLGDLDIYVSDGNYGEMYPKTSEMKDSGVAFIRANNLKDGKLTWQDMRYIDLDLHKVLKSGHLKTGDILVTTRGDVGITAYVTEEFNNANINAQICLLRTGDDLAKQYLFYSLQTAKSKNQFTQLQTGSALKQLPKGKLALLVIGVPSKDEQERIAGFLTMVDERVVAMSKKVELLQQYKKGVMQKIFSQKLRFKDENGQNYPDWQEEKLGDALEFARNGLSLDQNSRGVGVMVTRIETISQNRVDINKVGFVEPKGDISQYKLRIGDMLFSNINSPSQIGRTVIVDRDYDLYHGMNLLCLRVNSTHNPIFIYYVLTSNEYKQHFEAICNKAVNQASINQSNLKKTKLVSPSKKEQQKIADFLTSLDEKLNLEKNRLEQVKLFKKSLLQRMFV